jgi:phage anti-repressor protein
LANLVTNGLCSVGDLHTALGVNRRNIERYTKSYREDGAEYFFSRKETRGQCHKMTSDKLESIQSELDAGLSKYRVSKNHNVSEAAISYHIKNGNLKKKIL